MRLLFICSGNTCRSPLAEAAWRALAPEIDARETVATSAGLGARDGERAAFFARQIAREWGVSLEEHRARLVWPELVEASDLVVAMTREQAAMLREHFALDSRRVRLLGSFARPDERAPETARLDPLWGAAGRKNDGFLGQMAHDDDILDPFGASLEAYQACAAQIRRCVRALAQTLAGPL